MTSTSLTHASSEATRKGYSVNLTSPEMGDALNAFDYQIPFQIIGQCFEGTIKKAPRL